MGGKFKDVNQMCKKDRSEIYIQTIVRASKHKLADGYLACPPSMPAQLSLCGLGEQARIFCYLGLPYVMQGPIGPR